jgi:hypothetical protein
MIASVITHALAERRLLDMPVGQGEQVWGRRVLRTGDRTWSVAGGPPLLLLPAIDAALGRPDDDGVRFPADYRRRLAGVPARSEPMIDQKPKEATHA